MGCLFGLRAPPCRTQSIEGFLVSQASAAALATAAAGGVKRRKSSAAAAAAAGDPLAAGRSRLGSSGDDAAAAAADDEDAFGADGLFSNASLHLQAAAAEQAAAAAELAAAPTAAAVTGAGTACGAELQRLQQQEALLRPVAQPRLPAVETQLSSIWELLGEVQDEVHGELQQLFKSHTWVGMVSAVCGCKQRAAAAARAVPPTRPLSCLAGLWRPARPICLSLSKQASCQHEQHILADTHTQSPHRPSVFGRLSPLPAGLPSRLSLLTPQADHRLALLQHGTKLYLVNMAAISRDVFYQLLLTRWEAMPVMQLAQPLHVGTLMELALRQEEAAGRWQVRRRALSSGACAGMQYYSGCQWGKCKLARIWELLWVPMHTLHRHHGLVWWWG